MGKRGGRGRRPALAAGTLVALLVVTAYADDLRDFLKKVAAERGPPAASRQSWAKAKGKGKAKPPAARNERASAAPAETDDAPATGASARGVLPGAARRAAPVAAVSALAAPGAPPPAPLYMVPIGAGDERPPAGTAVAPRIFPPRQRRAAPVAKPGPAPRPRSVPAPALASAPVPAVAPAPPLLDGRPGDQRAILSLTVNLVDKGELFVVLRAGDVLVPVADLEGAGIRGVVGERETLDGKLHVSLRSLTARGVSFAFDERALTLRLTAPAADLGATVIDLGPRRPDGIIAGQAGSAFLNYAFRLRDTRATAVAEAGASLGDALLYTQFGVDPDGHLLRGLTNLSYADRTQMRRYILGDTFASSGLLGSGLFMGGASVVRDFALDPYFYRFPSAGLSGVAATPSTVDVYVNGMLVHREDVAPGTFQVNNLPVPVGAGDARVVVRDAFGREQVLATPFYFSTGTLRPGLSDYGFHVGLRRNDFATRSWDYAPPIFLGRYRLGLRDGLTAGARVEGSDQMASGGPTVTLRTLFGEVEAAAAVSQQTRTGAAASLAYTYIGRNGSFGGLARAFSDRFANLTLTPASDRATVEANLFAGASLGTRVAVTGRVGLAQYRDAGGWQQLGLISSVQVSQGVNLFLTANRTVADNQTRPRYDAYLTVSWALPDRVTASAFAARQDGQTSAGAEASRPLPLGPGYGYRVRTTTGAGGDTFSATALAQTEFGRYEAGYDRVGGTGTATASAAGGLVAVGGNVYATRPAQGSFGLIRVPGVAGVRGYLNNQEVGRTDARGDLLVPELVPYYGNRLSIADEDLPIDYRVGETEKLLAPPLRGGGVAAFDVAPVRTVTGSVVMELGGRAVVPAYGQIAVRVGQGEVVSPLGRDGEFYFENLRPGRFTAAVDAATGTCRIELEVPAGGTPFVDAGRLHCTGAPPPGAMTPAPVPIDLLPKAPLPKAGP